MHDRARMPDLTRRDWILGTVSAATWAAIASAQQHAHRAAASPGAAVLEYFDPASGGDVAAIAARIIPSDDGPGATEAGAVFFIDRALRTFASDAQPAYRDGLADLKSRAGKASAGANSFAELSAAQQDQLLHSIEGSEFFALLRQHTVLGWLGGPQYGGNRGGVGWKYIGFEDRGFFTPPFGFYDAGEK